MNNKLLVLGTMAYDAIETPFGKTGKILGGCATYIGLAASHFKTECGLISIIGSDFEKKHLDLLKAKNLDLTGVEQLEGEKTFFWSGKYHNDLNSRTTLDTQLNVLTKFKPRIPDNFKDASVVLLGNLDPNVQLEVLDQMDTKPDLLIMDTMNFWIESYREKLDELISRVDVISINDEEARQITQKYSLVEAAKDLQAMGPKYVVIKKGEHGALLFNGNDIFCAPGLPLEEVFDPTGAGDSFIGGFAAYLVQRKKVSFEDMKTAVIVGSALASFTVQEFGTTALEKMTFAQLAQRIQAFKSLTEFEIELI
ncbi:PfkB family carbohydrate kinase [Flavobacteriaceae bacterium]|nr:PfkB family carbohydrate kinase [Flavobacteriaceae bacterium]MDB3862934.1 PfkB family carbohydrate kinase [Flavobacteriaceae bacterium]MDC3354653.1 PfkB family carbohydrate kinase [Flavobacteriaceae bacterium]